MRKFIRRISILVVFVLVLTSFLGVYAQLDTKKAPKYIFYFIGDGMGISQRKLADIYLDEKNNKNLIMNNFPVNSFIDTRSLNSYITDSAAAGTALATGYKTNNGMISVRPDSDKKLETIVELAENKGLSTGVISTTRLTHATPAVFTAHNKDRGKENEIAIDLLDSGVDFFYGGGLKHFIPSKIKNSERKDNKNLLEKFADKNYEIFTKERDYKKFYNYDERKKVFACFTNSHIPYKIDRESSKMPGLKNATSKAISVLKKDKDGFFLMVEGGRIDHGCHLNDPAATVHETIAFDNAIRRAYQFYKKHKNETLIVVLADHETGGLGLGYGHNYSLDISNLLEINRSVSYIIEKKIYKGKKSSYIEYIESYSGYEDLTEKEKSKIIKKMNKIDNYVKNKDKEYSLYTNYALTSSLSTIISERNGIQWTSSAHTAVSIPLSAVGVGAKNFSRNMDNTEVAKIIFDLLK